MKYIIIELIYENRQAVNNNLVFAQKPLNVKISVINMKSFFEVECSSLWMLSQRESVDMIA